MGNPTNNGANNQAVGAIEITSSRAAAFLIGNSSSSVGGTLTLNGATVNSIANTILRNNSSQSFTIQNTQGAGASTMAVALSNATANVVNVDSSGSIIISSNISGSGKSLTLNAGSTGDLRLSGTNTWDGGINIAGGSSGGRLRIDAVAALPTTGTVAISTGGRMTLNLAGTYGGVSQALTFNPNQTANPSLDTLSGAAVTWQGTVAINADTRIESNGSAGSLNFSGNVSGSGTLIKQATGNLILSGSGNTMTGGTQIGSGTITVNNGSLLGTGALTLAQTGTNATTLTLNNTAQSVGSLSSTWVAVSGTIAQTINLNSTTLSINQAIDGTFGTGAVSTLTSTIAGTGAIIKSGAGMLSLTSANTYDGTTTINNGLIGIDDGTRLGLAPGSFTANRITLNGGGLKAVTNPVLFAAANNRGITLGGSGGTFDTGSQGITIETPIAGTGDLTKTGNSSALTLNAANTYGGATNVRDGILALYTQSGTSTNRLPTTTVLTLGNTGTSATVVLGSNGFNPTNPAHQTVAGLATNVTTSTNTIISDSTTNANLTINNTANYNFAGTIGGAGARNNNINIIKQGSGTQTLAGPNTYIGTTLVSAGKLLVNGTHTGGGTYTVDTGGTLGGNGTINAAVNVVTGTLSPGNSPDRLTINGNVTFTNTTSSVFAVEINGPTVVTNYDQLQVGAGGSLNVNGATLTASLGFDPVGTEKIFITDDLFAGNITGTFNGYTEGASIMLTSPSNIVYAGIISYLGDFSTLSLNGGNDIVIFNFTAIPEPGTIAFVGLTGFFGLQWYLRRKPAIVQKDGEQSEGKSTAEPVPAEAIA
ncbi:MAG TPA: autotransporter-associated beta strand repeat-containing protein [Gemmatales bacterium]|nr:autotransporter-associated beta strand repeat-containing protein [Gemmatales bacterium]